jgi:beta-glucanase (GH16 family)
MKKVFFVFLLMQIGFAYSQPSCLHGTGIGYLLDLWLAQFGACNCQKVGVFLNQMPDCIDSNYQIVFEDNFNGNTLDLSKWEIQPWGQGALVGHANIEYNSLNNVEVSSGTCKIIAKNENIITKAVSWKPENEILSDGQPNLRAYSYTSANLWTKEKFFLGKYEIRCRMPVGAGLWPAFWLFGGQRWNEIDVFDNYSGVSTLVTSVGHDFDGNGTSEGCSQSYTGFDFAQWHTITCLFDFDKIIWMVDNVIVRVLYRFTSVAGNFIECGENIATGTYWDSKFWPLEPMSIIMNLAVGSGSGPCPQPSNNNIFPSVFEIDYIKYWKKNNLSECNGNNIVLSHNTLPGNVFIRAQNSIVTNGNISPDNNQKWVAGNFIELRDGFETSNNLVWEAYIEECEGANMRLSTSIEQKDYQEDNKSVLALNNNYVPFIEQNLFWFNIYPNPNKGIFTIYVQTLNNQEQLQLQVIDVYGKQLLAQQINNSVNHQIDLSAYSKGIYYVSVTSSSGFREVKKVVVN